MGDGGPSWSGSGRAQRPSGMTAGDRGPEHGRDLVRRHSLPGAVTQDRCQVLEEFVLADVPDDVPGRQRHGEAAATLTVLRSLAAVTWTYGSSAPTPSVSSVQWTSAHEIMTMGGVLPRGRVTVPSDPR